MNKIQIGVIGGGDADTQTQIIAQDVGRYLASRGITVICGGLKGVMEACARGVKMSNGTVIGILPNDNKNDANEYIDHYIVTNMGHARNSIIVLSSDALIAIGGEYGTLSEIALALKMEKRVIGIHSNWFIEGMDKANTAHEAVNMVLEFLVKD